MNIWWGALIIASIGTFFWGLDRAIRKSEEDAARAALETAEAVLLADPEYPGWQEDKRWWARQDEIVDIISAVEYLETQAREKKLFAVAQQLQTVITVLDREYDLCRRSPDAFRITETWEK